jgi:DNA-binding PucR family transcriptional regulator
MAAGARLVDLLQPIAADLGVDCWVLTPGGRLVAGTVPLPPPARGDLATAFLTAARLPARITVDGRPVWLATVPGRPEHRLASWLLACAAVHGTAESAVPDAAAELVSVAALERAQVDESVRIERRLADQLGAALAGGGEPAGLRGRLLSCGLAPDATLLVVAASLTGLRSPPELAIAVGEEIVRPAAVHAAVTGVGLPDAVLAVLVVAPEQVAGAVDAIRGAVAALAPGLGTGRLAVGVSAPVAGAGALPGAVEQARHALRTAIARTQTATVVSAGELASHLLLLAGVPADTRRAFRERLLGPLEAYDRAHDAGLVRTLDAFLDCGGSWSRCAALLHIHVNTLRYRIGRIEQLTGRDPARFEDRVDFFLALRLPR